MSAADVGAAALAARGGAGSALRRGAPAHQHAPRRRAGGVRAARPRHAAACASRPSSGRSASCCAGSRRSWSARPILVSGVRGIVTGDTRRATDQLVAIAVLAAAASGNFVTATLIPLCSSRSGGSSRSAARSARAPRSTGSARSPRARRCAGATASRSASTRPRCVPGDDILVRPGERIPVDGTVLEGRAAVDQSAVTGESRHEDVGPGSPVFAGTVALDGLLRVQVRGTGADTVLGRVVGLLAEVERATRAGAPALRAPRRRLAPARAHARRDHALLHGGSLARDRRAGGRDADRARGGRPGRDGGGDDDGRRACAS